MEDHERSAAALIVDAKCAVSSHLYQLVRPDVPLKEKDDKVLEKLFNVWRAHRRAYDAMCNTSIHTDMPMPKMPPNDKEHLACRRMAALNIERIRWGEHVAKDYLAAIIEEVKKNCSAHPSSCACKQTTGWTGENLRMIMANEMSNAKSDSDLAKSLFLRVQGVNFDDKCPHALPFYACMSCSH